MYECHRNRVPYAVVIGSLRQSLNKRSRFVHLLRLVQIVSALAGFWNIVHVWSRMYCQGDKRTCQARTCSASHVSISLCRYIYIYNILIYDLTLQILAAGWLLWFARHICIYTVYIIVYLLCYFARSFVWFSSTIFSHTDSLSSLFGSWPCEGRVCSCSRPLDGNPCRGGNCSLALREATGMVFRGTKAFFVLIFSFLFKFSFLFHLSSATKPIPNASLRVPNAEVRRTALSLKQTIDDKCIYMRGSLVIWHDGLMAES